MAKKYSNGNDNGMKTIKKWRPVDACGDEDSNYMIGKIRKKEIQVNN